jgi:hypothetical protein
VTSIVWGSQEFKMHLLFVCLHARELNFQNSHITASLAVAFSLAEVLTMPATDTSNSLYLQANLFQ